MDPGNRIYFCKYKIFIKNNRIDNKKVKNGKRTGLYCCDIIDPARRRKY